ncbi:MAG TPA: hypothetical protein ACN46L_04800 [Prochlorococcus sp.]
MRVGWVQCLRTGLAQGFVDATTAVAVGIMAGLDLENTQRTFFTAVGRSRKPATTHRNCFPEQGQLF